MNYDVIIPVSPKNIKNINFTLSGIKRYLQPDKIILIGNSEIEAICDEQRCYYIDENSMYYNLNYHSLHEVICKRDNLAGKRTGWYFQQFLKMGYARVANKSCYLVWDADTIPVKKIEIYNSEGIPYFDVKEEFHKPYFTTMNRLFDNQYSKVGPYSFISEHMLIKTDFMCQMLDDIEANRKLEGEFFWEKVINAVTCIDLLKSGFSEFETYGNYVCQKWPGTYIIRRLKSCRQSVRDFSTNISEKMLEEYAEQYDIVTCEIH